MKKLLIFQQKVGAIQKDATNPFYHSKYFDINTLLAEVKPILSELGLVLTQPLEVIDGKQCLTTEIRDTEVPELLAKSTIMLPDIQDPQKMGSAISYFRRYSLQSLLSLQAEDDDGNSTTTVQAPKQPLESVKPTNTVNPSPAQQTAAQPQKCARCGAPMIQSKTKGTYYCSALCWKV